MTMGSVALTLPGARSKSEASWDLSDLAHEPRRAAVVAAPAGIPLAAHLGDVDPAPVQRYRAQPRRNPAGVVAGRRRRRARALCRRPAFYGLVAGIADAVRLERRAVLPSVQWDPAFVVGHRPRPGTQQRLR